MPILMDLQVDYFLYWQWLYMQMFNSYSSEKIFNV